MRSTLHAVSILFVFVQLSPCTTQISGMTFGHRQVQQLLDDRADLRQVIVLGDPIHEWLVDAFEGKYLGKRIYWCSNEPANESPSCFLLPVNSYPAHVLVTSDAQLTSFDRLALVVFELHNVENSSEMIEIARNAKARRIGREEYADKLVRMELHALARTREFFQLNVVDGAMGRYYNWTVSVPPTFEEYKAIVAIGDPTRSNFELYRRQYDKLVRDQIRPNN